MLQDEFHHTESLNAALTNIARQKLAKMLMQGKTFAVNKFEVGDGSHNADPTLSELPNSVYGPEEITTSYLNSESDPVFVCQIPPEDAQQELSTIGILGEIVSSPIESDPDIGNTFLVAVGIHTPREKGEEILEYRLQIQI